jgi:hypothetical protein
MDLSRNIKDLFIVGIGTLGFLVISYSIFSLTGWHINLVILISFLILFALFCVGAYLFHRYKRKIINLERITSKIQN